MKKFVKSFTPSKCFNPSHHKEKGFFKDCILVGFNSEELVELANLRLYKTRTHIYACFWANPVGAVGSGYAESYGYYRAYAAAVTNALEAAGVNLEFAVSSLSRLERVLLELAPMIKEGDYKYTVIRSHP